MDGRRMAMDKMKYTKPRVLKKEHVQIWTFLTFEYETSKIWPFATDFDGITDEMIEDIYHECNKDTQNIEILYNACEEILGVNPILFE